MVTKNQIVNGVIKFIENDMAQAGGSGVTKFIVHLAKNALKMNPDIITNMLENPLIKSMMSGEDGLYDIAGVAQLLKETMAETGTLPLHLPHIPLLLPEGDIIRFDTGDIDKVVQYIQGAQVA